MDGFIQNIFEVSIIWVSGPSALAGLVIDSDSLQTSSEWRVYQWHWFFCNLIPYFFTAQRIFIFHLFSILFWVFFIPCSFAHLPPTQTCFQRNCHADAEKWQSVEAPSLNLSSLINTDMLLFLKCHGEGSLNKTSVSHHKRNLPENEPERNPRETSTLRVTDPSSNLSYIKSHKHPQRSKIEAWRHLSQIRKAEAAFAL